MKIPGVYILESFKNGRYYIGSTDDIENRISYHNSGWVTATKNNRPFKLVAFIECSNINLARSYEFRLKRYKRRDILEKVIKDLTFPWMHD
ncbi:MAG: hypothetical protein A3B23_01840 [Candidatus Colwellbacteria bacterium RIFCSPLOWO2_01_FULL_48_10]|uniref:GIY-YIG domain-containing protein n=1 Tax=Candidatus Colwellbacteria bacterium RIFCSPLOWO2_01_FULL_48_10 TaxID=1797690 RepID=A0A1G1Z958_9BACT|nr:MAG: hypothetical protein A3B23_01840 [Candidatus Colwellbacteria bacterium RIFCSPLOWO2_01_FULL_48_10]